MSAPEMLSAGGQSHRRGNAGVSARIEHRFGSRSGAPRRWLLREVAKGLQGRREPALVHAMERSTARAARLYEASLRATTAPRKCVLRPSRNRPRRSQRRASARAHQKTLGKYEELIESLLDAREQRGLERPRRALKLEIGELYENELAVKGDQAVAAQAFCEDPLNDAHVTAVERLAGNRFPPGKMYLGARSKRVAAGPRHRRAARFALSHGPLVRGKGHASDLALPWLTCFWWQPNRNHDRAVRARVHLQKSPTNGRNTRFAAP